ncbi:aminoglycoside phosphotransferase family protein [Tropicimonas sp. IMCC6043]|uniref:aminoglycoside phosphotransferase family protein n=1 Tax=Tropicimonas sp. IMCC6043 TaxID=2510645 RepID=UPI00101BE2AB|nr:phosphotransferase [Tropicimonas sp. IMCC6043]RYH10893.1 aminoglycoside phosphotransferase [Tropicimonas sp. IMCC6043]
MTRQDECRAFLVASGWEAATRTPLAGDASARRYERLSHPDLGRAVLMDAPPDTGEDTRPFRRIADHLARLDLSPPRCLAQDTDLGFLLLEDLGDAILARLVAADPARETPLYLAATETLLALHAYPPPPGLPPFGPPEMARATDLALTFYATAAGATATPYATAELARLVEGALRRLPEAPPVLALRDFHAENLIWLPDRTGPARIGLLDFQDAFAGHPAYDLVSLLEDARRDVSEPTRAAALAHFAARGGHDPDALALACATLGAQRNLRILGVFARLCLTRGKAQYVDLVPRVWGHLARDLTHPDLAELAAFVRTTLPAPTEARLARIREAAGTCPTP